MPGPSGQWVRTSAAAGAATAGWAGLEYAFLLAAEQQWRVVAEPGPAGLDEALTLVASAVAVLLCTWLGLSTVAALLTHLPGRVGRLADQVAAAWAPPAARRLAAVLVGATVTSALAPGTALGEAPPAVPAATAAARAGEGAAAGLPPLRAPGFTTTEAAGAYDPAGPAMPLPGFAPTEHEPRTTGQTGPPAPVFTSTDPAPGWVPTRPLQRRQPSSELLMAGHPRHEVAEVVVHRGDTLWGIVARHLGPQASDAEVARAWPRWYAANQRVIGDDPDLIKPGQVLHAPGTHHAEAAR